MAVESPTPAVREIYDIYPDLDRSRVRSGKVRDTLNLGDGKLLMMASDRISVFDVVLPTGIPRKGEILNDISNRWVKYLNVPSDFISDQMEDFPIEFQDPRLAGRTSLVREGVPADIECIARGYITGSMWSEYKRTGQFVGQRLEQNLQESQELENPIFTPSTKAKEGHDMNIDFETTVNILARQFPRLDPNRLAGRLRDATLEYYQTAAAYALSKGIIIADTKFEFIVGEDGIPVVCDERLTPDSSRFWPVEHYEVGRSQPSFDKQYVRDYAEGTGWDKKSQGPELPDDVVVRTIEKYREAQRRLFGATT